MNNWQDRVLELYMTRPELNYKEITAMIEEEYGMTGMYWRVYRVVQGIKKLENQLADLGVLGYFAEEHVDKFDRVNVLPPETVRAAVELVPTEKEKHIALENYEPKHTTRDWDGVRKIKIGIMGDTQFGSKYAQMTYLNEFYDLCMLEGITDIYHTGDITDGLKMRAGHEQELYMHGADDMKDDVVKNYPRRPGITTHFITGNHDASLYKHVGMDIGKAIAKDRPDMEYLGRDCAVVNLTPNCTLELRHPWDGTAYALSYKVQKMIEGMEADSKPNILAVGHYHKAEYLFYRNVHTLQTGCFQGQTPFTRGKGISVHMGGWIVTIYVDAEGTIQRFAPEFIPFYAPIADDYKKYM